MVVLNADALQGITPGAEPLYREAFEHFAALEPFGVLASKRRADHFLAQALHESGGLHLLVENLNYSAKRMTQVWPLRFPTLALAEPFAHNPPALANKVYGGRMGNADPNDGWRYIGRGLLQLTGRASYQKVGKQLGLDLEGQPELVLEPAHCLPVAGAIWQRANCNEFADLDSISRVTKAINGGLIGIEDRWAWLKLVIAHRVILEA